MQDTESQTESQTENTSDAGQETADLSLPDNLKGHYVPISRLSEVSGKIKAFKEFGDPATIRASLNRLNQLEASELERTQQAAKAAELASMTDAEAIEKQYGVAKSELLKIFPQLANLDKFAAGNESFAAMQEQQRASNVRVAEGHLQNYMKNSGVPTTPEIMGVFKSIVDRGLVNPAMAQRFNSGDFSVIDELIAPAISGEKGYLKSLVSQRVEPLPRMGGLRSVGVKESPDTMEQAHLGSASALRAMLSQVNG